MTRDDRTCVVHAVGRGRALAGRLDLPTVAWFAEVASTMDVAHALAADGATAGTLVLADVQTRGRGRGGKAWTSARGAGLWMTLVERPIDPSALEVLSLRVGLRAAQALDRFAPSRVQLKWPNDLMLPGGKVGGILVEVRWRGAHPEWVAIGLGVNLHPPEVPGGVGLTGGPEDSTGSTAAPAALDVLEELMPALRSAAAGRGVLRGDELDAFSGRDWARGRRVVSPAEGTVAGISPAGAVLIETSAGLVARSSGSLVFGGESP